MRDGVSLIADLFLGSEVREPRPVVLIRTPYNRKMVSARFDQGPFLDRGYAVLFQDVRGTGQSEGILEPLMNEAEDGADTIQWLIGQPWCNGQVVTTGPSYMGGVQLQLAVRPVPGHETAFIQVPAANIFGIGMLYDGDLLTLETAAPWALMMAAGSMNRFPPEVTSAIQADLANLELPLLALLEGDDLVTYLSSCSLRCLPVARHVPFWHEWLDNRDNPSFFDNAETNSRLGDVTRPLMHFAGWYDLFLRNALNSYAGITAQGATPEARDGQRLIVGPWSHVHNPRFREFPGSDLNDAAAAAAWFDLHLRGSPEPLFDHRVMLYVMGEDRWRAETEWPRGDAAPTRFYLHSDGQANGVDGSGQLLTEAPSVDAPADQFRADPSNPVISMGGHGVGGGPVDQRLNAGRDDILVYTTEPLAEDIEVTGNVRAVIHAASSATDTDWFVKLIDVFPDGEAYNIVNGGARARYRHSRTDPVALKPGEIVAYDIDLQATSNVFKKGHRIRLEITSSDFPNFDRNPNQFIDLSTATADNYVVAEQTVFHDVERPSFVELPVIPSNAPRVWIDAPFPRGPGEQAYSKYFEDTDARPLREIDLADLKG